MNKFKDVLNAFEDKIQNINPFLLSCFNHGIDNPEKIKAILKKNRLEPTEDLVIFYQWKNGIDKSKIVLDYRAHFCLWGIFFPLEYQEELYQITLEMNELYFPIMENRILINLDIKSTNYGSVFLFDPSLQIIEPKLLFNSIKPMFLFFIECFEQKAFIYNYECNGDLEINWDLYNSLLIKYQLL